MQQSRRTEGFYIQGDKTARKGAVFLQFVLRQRRSPE